MNLTKRIGNTIYNVKITVADDDGMTMEDSILHMIQNLPLATDGKSGIMNVPLTSGLQPERMKT